MAVGSGIGCFADIPTTLSSDIIAAAFDLLIIPWLPLPLPLLLCLPNPPRLMLPPVLKPSKPPDLIASLASSATVTIQLTDRQAAMPTSARAAPHTLPLQNKSLERKTDKETKPANQNKRLEISRDKTA